MNKKAIGILFCGVLIMLLASTAGAVKHLVNVANFTFTPGHTIVSPGDTVRWQWVAGLHTTTSDPSSPISWLGNVAGPGQFFELPIRLEDGAGPFPYHCDIHPTLMKDTVFVTYGPKLHVIVVKDFAFEPQHVVINPGDTVRWVLQSGTHTTTSAAGSFRQWNSPVLSTAGETFDVVFNLNDGPGPFPFECAIHPSLMKDTIFVNYPSTVHHIRVSDFAFTPTHTVANQGDTVIWAWESGVHTTTSDASSFKSWSSPMLQAPGDFFQVVFTTIDGPGPFPYACSIHPTLMMDTIFVNYPSNIKHIAVSNFAFTPKNTHVNQGDTVIWARKNGSHTSTSDGSSPRTWDSGLLSTAGSNFKLAFNVADGFGPFPYHCTPHSVSMQDTIFVNGAPPPCICGDADGSGGAPDISDAVFLISYIFSGGTAPGACGGNPNGLGDADGSGGAPDISDAVFLISYIFSGGAAPHCP